MTMTDDDETSSTDSKDRQQIPAPPEDIRIVIDKMASYVARNGDEFAEIVRAKNDPRFTFLDPEHMYHPYYKRLMQEKRGVDVNGKKKKESKGSFFLIGSYVICADLPMSYCHIGKILKQSG